MNCPICDRPLETGASRCILCGAPSDLAERSEPGRAAECGECGATVWSLVQRCPSCGSPGYPALRPRLGDKSRIGPGEEGEEKKGQKGKTSSK